MRASVNPVRDFTLDVLDVARDQASGFVDAGAGLLAEGIDVNVDRLAASIEDLADKAPVVTVEVGRRRRSRRPLLMLVLVLVVGAVAFTLARRRTTPPSAEPPAPAPVPAPTPAPVG